MDTNIINKWSDLLLDTGKRNNLINFKDARSSTAEIIYPDIDLLFEKFCSTDSLEIYDIPENLEISINKSEKPKKLSKDEYLEKYKRFITRPNQILVYNSKYNNPMTPLKSIDKKSRLMLEETGISATYATFGFINWKESENSSEYFKAPILLAPITLSNDSAVDPYKICINDDDIVVNPILNFKLTNEYGISLPEYVYDSFADYITKIEPVINKLHWSISKECKIGIFSFAKLNMYRDLKENAEEIMKNENIRIMLGKKNDTSENYFDEDKIDKNLLIDLNTVVDADSSQLEAINMAKLGRSFVLQGPPGTGKSQTITNIIAQCLYDGKKVLFVSEKMSALNVVYNKIKKLGLEEFCLELHSHKSSKKEVIKELCDTLYLQKKNLKQVDKEIEIKEKTQKQLDEYEKQLHTTYPVINKSLYELYNSYFSIKHDFENLFPIPDMELYSIDDIDKISNLLEQYIRYISVIGYDYKNHEWYGYINQDNSTATKKILKSKMSDIVESLKNISDISSTVFEKYNINCDSPAKVIHNKCLFECIKNARFITPIFFDKNKFDKLKKKIEKLKSISDDILSMRSNLDNVFNSTIYEVDGKAYQNDLIIKYSHIFTRFFNYKEYKSLILNLRACTKDNRTIRYVDAVNYMKTLSDYQQKIDEYCVFEEDVKKHMGSEYSGINSDWNKLFQEINYLEVLHEKNFDFGNLDSMSNYEFEQSQKYFESIFDIWEKHSNVIADNIEYISKCFDKKIFDTENESISKAITKFENCLNNYEKLDSWFYFKDLISQLTEKGILNILDYLLKNNVEPAQIINAFKKGVFKLWIESIISKSPVLSQFNRVNQDQIIKTFSEKDKLNFELNIAKIQSKLSKNRPSLDFVSPGSAVSILQREEKKKRNVKSVRDLMSTIGELIQVLKPCFLMSPMSVSTFLKNINFDVVIFDEASQIFPQDAIGSIYRGKQLIVVGDSKQMPPSNFFNTTIESEYSSENGEDDITDFESILDVCASSFPEISLKWHYRSKSEELIAFSNKNFYRNSLITFPSVKSNTKWLGIDYHYINGGTFDHKTRSNLKEANYIVDLIYENIEKFPKRSLGVVAFSVSQQELIEELLFKRRRQKPEKESFFSQSKKEPFFIKNLETVQGDERDTIIFSIAYAKDADGRLLHNFGPINRQGGERRLNVATTRAKFNIQVVTSIHGYDIDLKRTASEGAKLLREYIDFAENGIKALNSQLNVKSDEHFDSTFEMEVYDFLKSKGFNVDTQVGCSGFKIDLALKSDNNSEYILAIECDGATYHSSKNARDRDRLRQEILESMGWKFYRIWSTDWFKNTSVEKERLLNVVRLALQNHDFQGKYSGTEEQKSDSKWLQPCRDNPTFEFSKYKTADIDKLHIENPINFKQFVKLVLEVESPLSEEWFLRRISNFFGREKVTKAVINEYKKKMFKCSENGILRKKDFLYLEGKNIEFRIQGENHRDFYFISPEELSVGMLKLIEKSISMGKEELYRYIMKLQDVYKLTTPVRKKLDEAFSLIEDKLNCDSNDKITLKNLDN